MTTEQTKFEPGDTVRFKGGTDEWMVVSSDFGPWVRLSNGQVTTVAHFSDLEHVPEED